MTRARSISRFLLRLGALAVLAAGLLGASPGEVGGCNVDAVFVQPQEHCVAVEDISCQRRFLVGEITDISERERCRCAADPDCGQGMPNTCDGFNWQVPTCRATLEQSNACLNQLLDANLVSQGIPTEDVRNTGACLICRRP